MSDDDQGNLGSAEKVGEGEGPHVDAGNAMPSAEEAEGNAARAAEGPAVGAAGGSPLGLTGLLRKLGRKVVTANQFFVAEKRTLNFSNGDKYEGDFDITHAR
jgi:hypothetical protein